MLDVRIQFFNPDQEKAALGIAQPFAISGKTFLITEGRHRVVTAKIKPADKDALRDLFKERNAGEISIGRPDLELQILQPQEP